MTKTATTTRGAPPQNNTDRNCCREGSVLEFSIDIEDADQRAGANKFVLISEARKG